MNENGLCENILKYDSEIRFCGISNNKNEMIIGKTREGVEKLLSSEDISMSIHYTIERYEKSSNLTYRIGNEKSSIIEYEKVTLITIPFNNKKFLLISTEPNVNYSKIINKSVELLNSL